MGTGKVSRKSRAHCKKKGFKKYFLATKNRSKDIDQIQDEFEKGMHTTAPPFDEDLPGGGQFYCAETGRHFVDAHALEDHKKSKPYKKRLKDLKEEKYTQALADLGAGVTKEVLPPAHPIQE